MCVLLRSMSMAIPEFSSQINNIPRNKTSLGLPNVSKDACNILSVICSEAGWRVNEDWWHSGVSCRFLFVKVWFNLSSTCVYYGVTITCGCSVCKPLLTFTYDKLQYISKSALLLTYEIKKFFYSFIIYLQVIYLQR